MYFACCVSMLEYSSPSDIDDVTEDKMLKDIPKPMNEGNPLEVQTNVPEEEEYHQQRIQKDPPESDDSQEDNRPTAEIIDDLIRVQDWAEENAKQHQSPARPLNMDRQFSEVLNHQREEDPADLQLLSHNKLRSLYKKAKFGQTYHIQVGDKTLSLIQGDIVTRIGPIQVTALFDPDVHHNQITAHCAKNARLQTRVVNINDDSLGGTKQRTRICPFVPLHIGTAPTLPGVFLVANERIPGGSDLLLGRPWMIGIEKRYMGYLINGRIAKPAEAKFRRTHLQTLPFPSVPSREWTPVDGYESPSQTRKKNFYPTEKSLRSWYHDEWSEDEHEPLFLDQPVDPNPTQSSVPMERSIPGPSKAKQTNNPQTHRSKKLDQTLTRQSGYPSRQSKISQNKERRIADDDNKPRYIALHTTPPSGKPNNDNITELTFPNDTNERPTNLDIDERREQPNVRVKIESVSDYGNLLVPSHAPAHHLDSGARALALNDNEESHCTPIETKISVERTIEHDETLPEMPSTQSFHQPTQHAKYII